MSRKNSETRRPLVRISLLDTAQFRARRSGPCSPFEQLESLSAIGLWERRVCDRLVLLLSERRQRLDARGAARGQVGRERGDGA